MAKMGIFEKKRVGDFALKKSVERIFYQIKEGKRGL
jgi:hypothetical protein